VNATGYLARRCSKCGGSIPKGQPCPRGCPRSALNWQAVISRNVGGTRKRQSLGRFDREKDARAALTEALQSAESGTFVERSTASVGDYLTAWLEGRARDLKPSTRAGYASIIRSHLIPRLGDHRLQHLETIDVERMVTDLSNEVSPRTTRNVLRVLQRAMSDAERQRLITRNPAKQINLPRATADEHQTWTAEQVGAFLTASENEDLAAAYRLLVSTGCRRGELLGIQWQDLDLDSGVWSVRRAVSKSERGLVVTDPKTAKSRRSIPLDGRTVEELKAHRLTSMRNRQTGWDATGFVFTRTDGKLVDPDGFTSRVHRIVDSADLPWIGVHGLRHSFATLALQAGVHPKVVADILGHSSVVVTLDIYSSVIPSMGRDAVDQVTSLFGT
jgi:integrase